MKNYHDLLDRILTKGKVQYNERTQSECRVLTGESLKFDVSEHLPTVTTRKLYLKSTIAEQVGFFKGVTSAKDFRDLGCPFWDLNANTTKAWLDNPVRKGQDDVGYIYGAIWNKWETYKFIPCTLENELLVNALLKKGWICVSSNYIDCETVGEPGVYYILQRQINQLEEAVRKIMTDPTDRRIIVSAWDPGQYDFQSLPSCHMSYTFTPFTDGKMMDVCMHMRSNDAWLGAPANIINTTVFLYTVCRLTGYKPGNVTIFMDNVHLYDNSYDEVRKLLSRTHRPLPKLELSDNITELTSVDQISGCFKKINPEDYDVLGYNPDAPIKVAMKA